MAFLFAWRLAMNEIDLEKRIRETVEIMKEVRKNHTVEDLRCLSDYCHAYIMVLPMSSKLYEELCNDKKVFDEEYWAMKNMSYQLEITSDQPSI